MAAKEEAERAHEEKSRLLAELSENYRKLEKLEALRDNLTNMIIHDLRTPLTSVAGHLQLLRNGLKDRIDAEEYGFLNLATKSTFRLSGMIDSLLDIGRLEKNEMPLKRKPCDLASLACEVAAMLGPESKSLNLRVVETADPVVVSCDRGIVQRVFQNLIGNAVKFTPPEGHVDVRLDPDGSEVMVSVRDTGPGIAPEHHDLIFERFGQVARQKSSTGLGLTFCKLAVEAHGGQIGVESDVGQGSTFWFKLPVGETED